MLFTSLEFLFFFLPIVLSVYFILPRKMKNYWLLLASLFFYAWGEPRFLIVMIFSIAINYFAALGIHFTKKKRRLCKLMLVFGLIGNLSLLFVYKYLNFFTTMLQTILPQSMRLFGISHFLLPIGISFFTFQAIGYLIDVYRGVAVQKNLAFLGLYISLFPQLIAGPIVRYTTVADEIHTRNVTKERFCKGMMRFVKGFNKKVLLANILSQVADAAFETRELTVVLAWLGAICYAFQILFDFGGYSEMAIGLGMMLGFTFLENFDYPYISKTITEFWRRWHISLGTWFRDYVYFPLGGSRVKSKLRLVLNLSVVWLITGLWHGASWNFILWGALYGVIIIFEKLFLIPQRIGSSRFLQVCYQIFTMFAVLLGWVVFRAQNLSAALIYISKMLGLGGVVFLDAKTWLYITDFFIIIIAAGFCATPIFHFFEHLISKRIKNACTITNALMNTVQATLFIISVSYIIMDSHNPFIYFNF